MASVPTNAVGARRGRYGVRNRRVAARSVMWDPNDAAASIPPTITTDTPTTGRSSLSGTWNGSASEVGSGAGYYSTGESLRINDDGTWILTERRGGGADVKYSGTLTVHGNTVVFSGPTRDAGCPSRSPAAGSTAWCASIRRAQSCSNSLVLSHSVAPE